MRGRHAPMGVILAGGIGRRIGGSKATVALRGRPLITYPLAAMQAAFRDVAVIAKADTELPSLPGARVWIEQGTDRHPLVGLVEALELAGGRPVVVCPVDLPFVTPALFQALAKGDRSGAAAVIATGADGTQPLLGCYQPRAAALLRRPAFEGVSVRDAVAAIGPGLLHVRSPDMLFNINAPEDLLTAAAMLDRVGSPGGD